MKLIVSKNVRIRVPEHFKVGPGSIIDDFCYFSTRVQIGRCSHVASGCSVAGGRDRTFVLGDFSSLSTGVRIWCASDDFANDIVTILPPGAEHAKDHFIVGDVVMESMTAVGSNSVIMPDNTVPEGTVIGALSYVPPRFRFKTWSVYAGVPVRFLRPRNKANVLRQRLLIEAALRRPPR